MLAACSQCRQFGKPAVSAAGLLGAPPNPPNLAPPPPPTTPFYYTCSPAVRWPPRRCPSTSAVCAWRPLPIPHAPASCRRTHTHPPGANEGGVGLVLPQLPCRFYDVGELDLRAMMVVVGGMAGHVTTWRQRQRQRQLTHSIIAMQTQPVQHRHDMRPPDLATRGAGRRRLPAWGGRNPITGYFVGAYDVCC